MKYEKTNNITKEKTNTEKSQLTNSKQKDSSSKIIFGNAELCAQFLRGYTKIPALKDVRPDDIEDVTGMFREERNSDVVKRVRMRNSDIPFYLVSLIEHKSTVDYNVVMQILRYMLCIWEEYEKDMERKQKGISRKKDFRYPPILPIVFYDGSKHWTAPLSLKERIYFNEYLMDYIPDYKCLLINPRDYSDEQLMEKQDILSIIMMMDKVQEAADFKNIRENIPTEYLQEIAANTSQELLDITAQVIDAAASKVNASQEEKDTLIGYVKEYKMGELFSHLKGYDIQAVRAQAREEARIEVRAQVQAEVRAQVQAEVRAQVQAEVRAQVQAEARTEVKKETSRGVIETCQELGASKDDTMKRLLNKMELTEEEAIKYMAEYWKED